MIKLFSSSKPSRASHNAQIHASRDWFILLGIGIVLIILSVLYNLWLIARVTSGQSFGIQQQTSPIPNVSLTAVDALFATRATTMEAYQHTYQAVDPSRVSR